MEMENERERKTGTKVYKSEVNGLSLLRILSL